MNEFKNQTWKAWNLEDLQSYKDPRELIWSVESQCQQLPSLSTWKLNNFKGGNCVGAFHHYYLWKRPFEVRRQLTFYCGGKLSNQLGNTNAMQYG